MSAGSAALTLEMESCSLRASEACDSAMVSPSQKVEQGRLLWQPTELQIENANMTRYLGWLRAQRGLGFDDYHSLWRWSVADLEGFWSSVWEFFEVKAHRPYQRVIAERRMPEARWFEGAELNYAE